MSTGVNEGQGRYVLLLDILGFSELVESKGAQEIYAVIDEALQTFDRWEELNTLFRTIYFSDTFIFYQASSGYADSAFLDVFAIGGMVLSALLAKGIPARGAISFGEFEVRADTTGKHQVYFGRALIDAHRAEQKENWIGIAILKSAWSPYEANHPGTVAIFQSEHVWLRRGDNVLLLNPFAKLRDWYANYLIGEVDKPYSQWDAPEFPNDILGFKFVRDKAAVYASVGDFSGNVAIKYHATLAFLMQVMGADIYNWGVKASEPENA